MFAINPAAPGVPPAPGAPGTPGAPAAKVDPSMFQITPQAGVAPAGAVPVGPGGVPPAVQVGGLSMGAYGEIKFGSLRNPDAGGRWQSGFDAARFVLLPTYAITPNIIFNAEIEFEHAGIAFDNDDKLHGTAEIEQMYIDFKIHQNFNWRAPGIDLVPVGHINLYHEPTLFYSVHRPELANGIVPTTWRTPSTSFYGDIFEGWKYQIQASFSIEDFGDSFDKRTDANRVADGTYDGGINGKQALGLSRPVLGDFRQLSNTIAWAGRVSFQPPQVPGLAGSASTYWSPNVTPRGAHASICDPSIPDSCELIDGGHLGHNSMTMLNTEFRYRRPETNWEFRGEAVYIRFSNPENLRANNDGDDSNNVGKTMWGASGEIAYHHNLGTILESQWELVPFYRYTRENLQTSGFAGLDANNPTGAGQLQFHTFGAALFPSPKAVLKLNYQKVIDKEPGGAKRDTILGGVGIFF